MRRFIFLLMLLIFVTSAWADKITVRYHDEREERQVTVLDRGGDVFLPIASVGEIFSARRVWQQDTRHIGLLVNEQPFILTVDNPIVSIGEQRFHLRNNIYYDTGTIWVPIDFVDTVLDTIVPEEIHWNPVSRELSLALPAETINILEIAYQIVDLETRIIVRTSEQLRFRSDREKPGHLVLNIEEGHADARMFTDPNPHGFLREIIAANHDNHFELDFHYNQGAKSYTVESFDNPPRIEVVFKGYDVNETPEELELRIERDQPVSTGYISDLDLIVIDAGHGGKDPGAIGPNGTQEKDITLDIAQKVADLIESRLNIRTYLTREDDTFIPLRRRTEIANNLKADLFISIHCNSSPSKTASGSETYFLSLAKTNEARAVAARENASLKFEMPEDAVKTMGDLDFILWDLAQYEYLEESSTLAEMTQDELARYLPVNSRRINQAPFYVLNGAYMPAILVETAFLSNPKEERMLNNPRFRQNIADAIVAAVSNYKQYYDKKMAQSN